MRQREINATTFKAKCLALLDQVAADGEPLVITKHGRPVARLLPVEIPAPLRGSVEFLVDEEELIAPIGEEWAADKS